MDMHASFTGQKIDPHCSKSRQIGVPRNTHKIATGMARKHDKMSQDCLWAKHRILCRSPGQLYEKSYAPIAAVFRTPAPFLEPAWACCHRNKGTGVIFRGHHLALKTAVFGDLSTQGTQPTLSMGRDTSDG